MERRGAERAKPGVPGWRGPDPRAPALYRCGRRLGAWGPSAAAVPTLSGQWRRRPHKGAGPLAHAKLPVNWRGHNGRSPRSRWAARHNVRAVGTRSPSLASRGLMLRAPHLNMLPFPRPRGGGEGRKERPLPHSLPSSLPLPSGSPPLAGRGHRRRKRSLTINRQPPPEGGHGWAPSPFGTCCPQGECVEVGHTLPNRCCLSHCPQVVDERGTQALRISVSSFYCQSPNCHLGE